MLSTLTFPQTTDVNDITRRNFLSSQALAVLNFTLLDNLSMYDKPNVEALWAYLWTLIEIPDPMLIFANCQKIVIFQISNN